MTVPAQFAKQQSSGTACIEQEGVELNADNGSPDHRTQLSAEKTTAALVALYDLR